MSDFNTVSDAFKTNINKFVLSKTEDELYKDDANIVMPIIRVKHIALPNKGDRWRVFSDDDQVIVVEGSKLTKKERAFLRGLEGSNFVISQVKTGVASFSALKVALKNHLKLQKKAAK